MRRLWTIPVKAMLLAGAVLCVCGALQAWVLIETVRSRLPATAAGLRADAARAPDVFAAAQRRVVGTGVALYVSCLAVTGVFAFAITRHRAARLARVLAQIAGGDLNATLEPLLDRDLMVVRRALLGMQTALTEMTGQLRHTDAQRRRLFADLAHELATPTSTILGIAEALARGDDCRRDHRRRFEQLLEQEATRLERLVGDVRDLAHLDDPDAALALARVDVGDLAARVVARLDAPAVPPRISVTAAAAWSVADAGRIDQVLTNLLSNARRYTPADGTIAVAVAADGDQVSLIVEDSGVGVPDELLPRLGERLLRLDPSRSVKTGGHGLGLSIVSAVVQRHRGRLRFERAALGGLRVVVTLPAA